MTSQQIQIIVLVAIVANALLIVIALSTMRSNRARNRQSPEVDIKGTHDTMVAMATSGTGAFGSPAVAPAGGATAAATADASGTGGSNAPVDPVPTTSADPDDGLDLPAELESPATWRHAVEDEVVRLGRYHRPATVVLIELDGFERLTERLGESAGHRLLVATAKTIRAQARLADRCARMGRGRFAILLPETDDIKAINFVERVRSECDRWLEAGEVTLRLAIGWATLDASEGAAAAIETAEHRLDAERRHGAGTTA